MITGFIQPPAASRVVGKSALPSRREFDALRQHAGEQKISFRRRPLRLSAGTGLDLSLVSFGYSLAGSSITIFAGYVFTQLTSLSVISVAETTLSLTASEAYVYVEVASDGSTASIEQSAAMPATTSNTIVVPLYHLTNEGAQWVLDHIFHLGDVHLHAVVV